MANFTSNFQNLKQNFPCMEIDQNMDLMSQQFHDLNQNVIQNLQMNSQSFMGFSNNDSSFSHQAPQFLVNNIGGESFPPSIFQHMNVQIAPPNVSLQNQIFHDTMKRKAMEFSESSSSGISSPPVSENGMIKKKNITSSRRGKRAKMNEDEDSKPKEVVHVRARRGQATDSHSLAERVRRGKINERLKCLQDIVPGCYKTMGMAVMLDEIINYVQSLQNQVEFLSMKLTAASTFYDFNSESETLQTMQKSKAQEIAELERLMKEANGGLAAFLQPAWPL